MTAAQNPLLRVRGLRVSFSSPGGVLEAVRGVSLDVAPGESVGLVGETGSGKSLTGLALARLTPKEARVEAEAIELEGRDLLHASEDELRAVRGRRIAYVFQDPMSFLNPVMTVFDQIAEPLAAHGVVPRQRLGEEVVRLLDEVRIPDPEEVSRAYPHQLSGGMQQRVLLAAALAGRPSLLVADEPTTALDLTVQRAILLLLGRLKARHELATLLISHDFGVVSEVCERVYVLSEGKIVETGSTRAVYENPNHAYTRKLIAAVKRLASDEPAPRVASRSASLSVGGPWSELAPRSPAAGEGPLVRLEDLRVHYRRSRGALRSPLVVRAVDGVSLELARGKTLAIVGESGSGKTTLGRTIVGLVQATGGALWLDGQRIDPARPLRRSTSGRLQMVFQNAAASLNPRKRIGESVGLALRVRRRTSLAERHSRISALFEQVGLAPPDRFLSRYPHELSGGQKQRVCLVRAMLPQPDLVVADEAVSALDVSTRAEILDLMTAFQEGLGLGYLFITHDLPAARYLADEVAVMHCGQVVEQAPAEQLFAEPRHPYTRALLASALHPDPARRSEPIILEGEAASPIRPPSGCRFRTRCPYAFDRCASEEPRLLAVEEGDHRVACHLAE